MVGSSRNGKRAETLPPINWAEQLRGKERGGQPIESEEIRELIQQLTGEEASRVVLDIYRLSTPEYASYPAEYFGQLEKSVPAKDFNEDTLRARYGGGIYELKPRQVMNGNGATQMINCGGAWPRIQIAGEPTLPPNRNKRDTGTPSDPPGMTAEQLTTALRESGNSSDRMLAMFMNMQSSQQTTMAQILANQNNLLIEAIKSKGGSNGGTSLKETAETLLMLKELLNNGSGDDGVVGVINKGFETINTVVGSGVHADGAASSTRRLPENPNRAAGQTMMPRPQQTNPSEQTNPAPPQYAHGLRGEIGRLADSLAPMVGVLNEDTVAQIALDMLAERLDVDTLNTVMNFDEGKAVGALIGAASPGPRELLRAQTEALKSLWPKVVNLYRDDHAGDAEIID